MIKQLQFLRQSMMKMIFMKIEFDGKVELSKMTHNDNDGDEIWI